MDNSNVVDDTFMDLDLNQEPVEPSTGPVGGLGTLLDELETAHDQIEERIRRLEAVTARARQRQRWRLLHNRHPQTSTISLNETLNTLNTVPNEVKCGKRDSSHLVAIDDGCGSSFFDCNICLDMAREPILTCCGHLFCWACFFRLPYLSTAARECPVCRGEVTDTSIVPIYGNGKSVAQTESTVPPRPQARRVESLRQRRVGGGGADTGDLGGRWRIRTHQFSSVLPDSATSLYSISSALDNAERLVDDLESFVNGSLPVNSQTLDTNAASSSSQIPTEGMGRMATSSRVRIRLPTVSADPNNVLFRELRRRRLG